MPSTPSCCAILSICLHLSVSSRVSSKLAQAIQGPGRLANFSQYFQQIILTLSSWQRRYYIQMQALNTFYFGFSPIALPNTFLAFSRSLHRTQKLAQKIHSLPKVNFLWGTNLMARSQICSALAISLAISSSKTAQLNQRYIYLLQYRFSSAGGFTAMADSQTQRMRSMLRVASSKNTRLSQASQFRLLRAIKSLQMFLLQPITTSSMSCCDPCSFQKLRYNSYSFLALSLGTCRSPNLKIQRALSYYLCLISNLAKSKKYASEMASTPSSVMTRSYILRAPSRFLFLNSNLATLRQVSRWGQAQRYLQSMFLAFQGSPILSQNLMKAIQAFSLGHHSIHRVNTSLALTQSPMSSSMQAYLNQNWSSRGRQQMALYQTFLAWLTNLFFISISAYFSHRLLLVQSISSPLSQTDLALANSLRFSSH